MGSEYVVTDEGANFREELPPEPGAISDVFGADAVDARVVELEVIVVFGRAHEPGGFLHYYSATDFTEAYRTRRPPEAVGCFKVDRRKVQCHWTRLQVEKAALADFRGGGAALPSCIVANATFEPMGVALRRVV